MGRLINKNNKIELLDIKKAITEMKTIDRKL
jgi:hypothetical protein